MVIYVGSVASKFETGLSLNTSLISSQLYFYVLLFFTTAEDVIIPHLTPSLLSLLSLSFICYYHNYQYLYYWPFVWGFRRTLGMACGVDDCSGYSPSACADSYTGCTCRLSQASMMLYDHPSYPHCHFKSLLQSYWLISEILNHKALTLLSICRRIKYTDMYCGYQTCIYCIADIHRYIVLQRLYPISILLMSY